MRKLKFFLSLFVAFTLGVSQLWATNFTLSSASSVTQEGITVAFDKGGGSTAPTWYAAGLRLYAGNTVTISCSSPISAVTFNWEKQGSKAFAEVTASGGTYSHPTTTGDGTWSGSATEIVFTLGSSGQLQLNTLSVTASGSSTDPTISASPSPLAFGKVWEGTYSEYYGYEATKELHLTGSNLTGDVSLSASGSFQIAYPYNATSAGYKYELTITPQAGAIDTTIVMAGYSNDSGNKTGKLTISSLASDFADFDVDITMTLVSVPDPIDGCQVDEIKIADLGVTGGYTAFTDKQASNTGHSGAVYAGTVARSGNATQYNIQLNSGQTSGKLREIASSTSGGTLKRVLVYWATQTANTADRSFVVYGSNEAYTGSETAASGTEIGSLTYSAGDLFAYLDVTDSYKYVQIVASGAIYADQIDISWLPSGIADPAIMGQTPFYPTTTVSMSIATVGADIIYTLNGDDPMGGDNTYSTPITIDATTTVKARGFKGVELGNIVTKVFTKATPISVTDAIALIPDANDVENDMFVVGYVCTAGTSVSSGQMTYYISADGTETNRLQIYKGKNLNNTDFAAISDLAVGDKVVVFGQLKNYQGTYEMNSGNYIVERVAKGNVTSLSLGGTLTKTSGYEAGDIISTDGLTATATYESGYKEDVTALATWTVDGYEEKTIYVKSSEYVFGATYGGKSDAEVIAVYANTHAITFSAPENGTLVVKYAGSAITSGDDFVKNTPLTVEATPASGYELATLTAGDNDIKETKQFSVGTEDIVVVATFAEVVVTPTISVKDAYAADITSIDFGNVDKGASVNQFNILLTGHNLTGDVKVTVTNSTSTTVFVTNGFRPSNTYYQEGGEINAAVLVIPYTSTGGDFSGTITFHSETGDFADIVIPLHVNIKPDASLAWSASTATAYTQTKPYTLPTLTNPHGVTVTYSGNNDDVATVDASTGAVTLVATGDVTITASFAGNDDYVAQTVEYTLTVKAPTGIRLAGEMTTKEYENGDHISVEGYTVEAVFGSPYDYYDVTSEATWTLDGVDIATKTITATAEYIIEATWQGFTAWEYVNLVRKTHAVTFNNPEHGNLTVEVGGSTFLSGAKFKKGTEVVVTISPDAGYEGSVTVNGETLVGSSFTIGTVDVDIVATFTEKEKLDAGIAFPQWQDTAYSVAKPFVLQTLDNPNNLTGIVYSSSNTAVATIDAETGEITIGRIEGGNTIITADFAGNDTYKSATVTYTLRVFAPTQLSIGGELAKTAYEAGEMFDFTGLTVTIKFGDNATCDVTDAAEWTVNNKTSLAVNAAGNYYVMAVYEGLSSSRTYAITVNTHAVTLATVTNGTLVVKNGEDVIASGDEFAKGTVLTVEATPATGYELATLTAGGIDILESKQFTVGTADVEVAATFTIKLPTHTYTVAGTGMLLPDEWCPACSTQDMTFDPSDGLMKLKVTNVELPIGYYDFKIAIDHRWNNGEADNNSSVNITKDGKYDITFIYDFVNAITSYELELKEELVIVPEIRIHGVINQTMILSDDQATATISGLVTAGEHSFKIVVNNGFRGRNVQVTRTNNSVENLIEDTDFMTLVADMEGTYTFTWTLATNTLLVTFPADPTNLEDINAGEKAIKVIENNQLIIIKNGIRYNAQGAVVR